MTRLSLLLSLVLSLSASVPLLAATADLHTVIRAPSEAPVGEVSWRVRVVNVGPDTATDVTVTSGIYRGSILVGAECRAVVPSLAPGPPGAPGGEHEITCSGTIDAAAYPYIRSIRARVESATPDPVPFDNEYEVSVRVLTNPDLVVFAGADVIDPGLPFDLNVRIRNLAHTEATGVQLLVDAPRSGGFVDLPELCTPIGDTAVRCAVGTVPRNFDGGEKLLTLRLIAPDDPSGADLAITTSVESDRADPQPSNNTHVLMAPMFRTFWVTTTADSGEGSLRSAIEAAATTCGLSDLCKVAFRIAGAERWKTIRPRTPLPVVRGHSVSIDGTTQTRFFGDSNPDGPEVEISGAEIGGAADGLVLQTTCSAELAGLTINGFDGAGAIGSGTWECVTLRATPLHLIRDNFLGTDPTGTVAVPNRRGIVIDFRDPDRGVNPQIYEIISNLISGNVRSGVMSLAGTRNISRNIIGLNRSLTAGLGNGASGVYIGPDSHGTDLSDNYIGFNQHFGIAIAAEAQWVAIAGSSIQANWQGGIDRGLDGVPEDVLKLPLIASAWWDEARGVTVIEGTLPDGPRTFGNNTVSVYANDAPDPSGYGEGQYFLGEVPLAEDGSFRLQVEWNLRGKWVAATATRRHYVGFAKPVTGDAFDQGFTSVTSEFGPVTEVR